MSGWARFDPAKGERIFPLASVSRPALGPTQLPVQWVPGALSPELKCGRGVTLATHPLLVPRLTVVFRLPVPSRSVSISGRVSVLRQPCNSEHNNYFRQNTVQARDSKTEQHNWCLKVYELKKRQLAIRSVMIKPYSYRKETETCHVGAQKIQIWHKLPSINFI
jgi:hypothetical protein